MQHGDARSSLKALPRSSLICRSHSSRFGGWCIRGFRKGLHLDPNRYISKYRYRGGATSRSLLSYSVTYRILIDVCQAFYTAACVAYRQHGLPVVVGPFDGRKLAQGPTKTKGRYPFLPRYAVFCQIPGSVFA